MVKNISKEWLDVTFRGGHVPCEIVHDHSCEWNGLKKFLLVFAMAYKFYIPIHLLPALIFKRKKLLKEPLQIIKNVVKNVLKSSSFISAYVGLFWYFICRFKNYRMKTDKWNIIYSSTLCSLVILIEPPHRRTELALYMFPRFLESLFLFAEKYGYVKSIPNGEVLVFSLAMAIIMYCYQNAPENIKATYLSMFKKYWGTN